MVWYLFKNKIIFNFVKFVTTKKIRLQIFSTFFVGSGIDKNQDPGSGINQCCGSVLVWIRIRGSMPLTNGSGFGSVCGFGSFYFHHWPSRCQQKTNFLISIFLHITFWRYFYIIFQIWKVKKKSQNSKNQGFSYYFCLMIEGSVPYFWLIDPDPGGPKTCGSATLG